MKVGDVVRHFQVPASKKGQLGVIVNIHPGQWPKDWSLTGHACMGEMRLNRRIDVLWSDGRLDREFTETMLEVVSHAQGKK